MKCKNCRHLSFTHGNGSPSRYYCTHPNASISKYGWNAGGAEMVERCERYKDELTMKYAPKWCPINSNQITKKEEINK